MKKHIIGLTLFAILVYLLPSCSDDLLDKDPLDSYSDPVVWSDINLAKTYLNYHYDRIPNGWNLRGGGYGTGPFAGESVLTKGQDLTVYSSSVISADNLGRDRGHQNWKNFSNIQELNFFLDNIDKVPDGYGESEKEAIIEEVEVLKGEALFLRAAYYHHICRSYGGVPLFDKPFQLGDDFSDIGRNTFEETINFIAKDCDDAAELLRFKSETEMGRATKEAALALKSRILLFAASDLTADGTAVNEYVGYVNPDRDALWTAARDAAKAVIDLGTVELSDFGAPDQELVADNYFAMFKAKDLSDKEIIWGRMYRDDVGLRNYHNRWSGPNGINNWGNNGPYGNFVDEFGMSDGTKFWDHFTINENKEYINISETFPHINPYLNRDPRFYATVLYDSAIWQPRFSNLEDIDPVGIYDRRTRIVIVNDEIVSERFGLDSRQSIVEAWNGGYTGYLLKKYMDDEVIGRDEPNQNIAVWLRYPEILFNFAEASLELGDSETAATYINMVRNRAGLPDFTGDITEALRHERKIEFAFENIRWYDLRRWKILEESFEPDLYGVDIVETTVDGETTTIWKQINAAPKRTFTEKLYWIPIERDELNRAPNLVQNPGYN
ncbi:MAG: RagB/SusD family nutrient uptake outer membrane protein [bacterium]